MKARYCPWRHLPFTLADRDFHELVFRRVIGNVRRVRRLGFGHEIGDFRLQLRLDQCFHCSGEAGEKQERLCGQRAYDPARKIFGWEAWDAGNIAQIFNTILRDLPVGAADAARNEARGAALSESLAEKTRWKDTLTLCPASTHELAMALLKGTDFPPAEIAKVCTRAPGASSVASAEQPGDLFAKGVASAANLLGKDPASVAALSPFADKQESAPFDMALYEEGEAAAKLIKQTTGGKAA
jgi:hypothetical protein